MTGPHPEVDPMVQLAFDELGRMSFAEHSLESVLQKVTDLAARVLPGEAVTSVTIVAGGRSSTVAASGPLALELDRVQYAQDDGPCLEAATTGRVVELLDTAADKRWGDFPRTAAERGCRAVLSFPLPPQELITGGLNVYARTAHPSTSGPGTWRPASPPTPSSRCRTCTSTPARSSEPGTCGPRWTPEP